MKKDGKSGDKEGLELWRRVARTVSAYAPEKPVAAKKNKTVRVSSASPPAPVSASARPSPPSVPAAGFDAATARRLKRGQIAPEATIDLHGMTQTAAFDALRRFMQAAKRRELRTVLVITGKGKGPEGGVLRRLVPLWLEGGEMGVTVLACMNAAPKDGGAGALYVRLKKV